MRDKSIDRLQRYLRKGYNDFTDYRKYDEKSLQSILEKTQKENSLILKESKFNTYHKNPRYTKNMLVEAIIKKILREIRPKRTLKRKSSVRKNNA